MRPWFAALGAALVGAMAVPAAAQPTPPAPPAASPQVTCEFYEISASMEKTAAVDGSLPQPLQKKVSKGAFKQWNTYKMQSHVSKTLVKKKAAENPLFKEIVESQLVFAKRATQWEQDTVVSRKMAYDHYWGANGAAKKI